MKINRGSFFVMEYIPADATVLIPIVYRAIEPRPTLARDIWLRTCFADARRAVGDAVGLSHLSQGRLYSDTTYVSFDLGTICCKDYCTSTPSWLPLTVPAPLSSPTHFSLTRLFKHRWCAGPTGSDWTQRSTSSQKLHYQRSSIWPRSKTTIHPR